MIRKWLMAALFSLIALPALAGQVVDLSQYKGKVVYLDFWASWCSPCRQSFPFMNDLQSRYGKDGLVIIGVNVDENRKDADSFLQNMTADFKVVYDAGGTLAESYKIPGMPTTLLIDRQGKVRDTRIGFHASQKDNYEAAVRQLLTEQ